MGQFWMPVDSLDHQFPVDQPEESRMADLLELHVTTRLVGHH